MPVTKRKLPGGKVRVSTPSGVKAKATSPENADALERILNAVEHNPNWKPTGKSESNTMPKPKTPQHAERPHHPYSPSSLQMREACPLWVNRGGTSEAAERGTKQHEFVDSRIDDGELTDDEFLAAADCIDYTQQTICGWQEKGHAVEEIIEPYLPIDGRRWKVPVYDPATAKTKLVKTEGTTAGYADRLLLVPSAKHIEIMDWKFGRWPVEEAKSNLQGIAYTCGALWKHNWAETARLSFKQPALESVTEHTFKRSEWEDLYLRVCTVVERAVDATKRAKREDYSDACPNVPACLFCGRRGRCVKLHNLILQVGRKYYPAQVPDNISPEVLNDPKENALGMRLVQIVKAWADGYRAEKTRQVLMGEAPPPEGFEVMTYSKRQIDDPAKFESAVTSKWLTPDEYKSTLKPTLGATENAVSAKAPRGQKTEMVKEFKAWLEEHKAVGHTDPVPYLGASPKAKTGGSSEQAGQ